MAKPIKTIFHAKFSCMKTNGVIDGKSRMEYYTDERDKDDFWQWVNDYLEEFEKEYEGVIIDSINMI